MFNWGLSQECKTGLLLKTFSLYFIMLPGKEERSYNYFYRYRDSIWQNSEFIPERTASQDGRWICQSDKDCLWKTYSQHHIKVSNVQLFLHKIKNSIRTFILSTFTQHCIICPSQWNKVRKWSKGHKYYKEKITSVF